ncbi:MAG: hypothetical protein A2540_09495 [Sulfurimonas sp. RIFOXYD2_FULL_37_8]|nr:MAG: hypothetical protein A2540_09495 [Sulfurimonas sp. RIFOXYD2_FULL_37_8]
MLKLLLELNEKLKAIEECIIFKCNELDAKLSNELSLKKDDMEDYELELVVSFFHKDLEDPSYELNESMKHIVTDSHYGFIGSEENYFYYPKNDFSSKYDCCGLFYRLYKGLSVNNILSIETIWWDIMPKYQYKVLFEPVLNKIAKRSNIIYSKDYNIYIPQAANSEKFVIKRLDRIYFYLSAEFKSINETFLKPLSDEELFFYHSQEYIDRLKSDTKLMESILRVSLPEYLSLDMVHRYILSSIKTQCSGTIKAAELAMRDGWAINLGGGFHHAYKDRGGMFSPYNDYALATIHLRKSFPILKIAYIDLDAHVGDGVIEFVKSDANFWVFDMYFAIDRDFEKGFDLRSTKDSKINLIALNKQTKDDFYLNVLKTNLTRFIDALNPDFIFYNGGSGDMFGMMDISVDGMIKRDLFVFTLAKERNIPICMCLSGGYRYENYKAVSQSLAEVVKMMS